MLQVGCYSTFKRSMDLGVCQCVGACTRLCWDLSTIASGTSPQTCTHSSLSLFLFLSVCLSSSSSLSLSLTHTQHAGTVLKNLEGGAYTDLERSGDEFYRDVLQTFDNALLYNFEGDLIWEHAAALKALFEEMWAQLLEPWGSGKVVGGVVDPQGLARFTSHICKSIHIRLDVCVCVHTYVCMYTPTFAPGLARFTSQVHTYTHTRTHTRMHTSTHASRFERWTSGAKVQLKGWEHPRRVALKLKQDPAAVAESTDATGCGANVTAGAAAVSAAIAGDTGAAAAVGSNFGAVSTAASTDSPRPAQPGSAVKKRSPPRKLNAAEELGVCAVCLNDGADEGNVIILCDACGVAVHQCCYGVTEIPADGEKWFCSRCADEQHRFEPAQCVLCPLPDGALKPVVAKAKTTPNKCATKWCHVSCAWFMPGTSFADDVSMEPVIGLDSLEKARWKLTCTLCKRKGVGACIQCADPRCFTAVHVTCAQKEQMFMEFVDEADDVYMRVYCKRHEPADREANFSVCAELAATPDLLSQVLQAPHSDR